MIKAVIDTNVIVSAYITKNLEAATSKVWEAVLQCKLTPIYNEEILNEYSDVLHREKFGIPERRDAARLGDLPGFLRMLPHPVRNLLEEFRVVLVFHLGHVQHLTAVVQAEFGQGDAALVGPVAVQVVADGVQEAVAVRVQILDRRAGGRSGVLETPVPSLILEGVLVDAPGTALGAVEVDPAVEAPDIYVAAAREVPVPFAPVA